MNELVGQDSAGKGGAASTELTMIPVGHLLSYSLAHPRLSA
jgi:hypothetical protein